MNKAYLLLLDGTVFEGEALGKIGTTTGEICFNTSMTGYQEVFTDPSYYGQVIITNNSHLGNYGISDLDNESEGVKINGVICRNASEYQFREQAQMTVQDYLEEQSVVGIQNIDTRNLVIHIRNKGAMNCIISSDGKTIDQMKQILEDTPSMEGLELSSKVSTTEAFDFGNSDADYKVAVFDLGIKKHILENLKQRKIKGTVYPARTPLEDVPLESFDGFFLSNGPGDPAAMDYAIEYAQKIIDSGKPTFGICLGHQIIALASGLSTYKLYNGHRGTNHPVLNLETGRAEITSQNHGFGLDEDSISSDMPIQITHRNLNDQTVEGIRRTDRPVFSVQYHPEASPGPNDASYLFDQFIDLLQKHSNN